MSLISFSRDKFIPSDEVSLTVRGNYLSVTRGYQVFTFFKTANNGVPVFLDDHIDRIRKLVQDIRTQNDLPVFLAGISRGAVSVGKFISQYGNEADGAVLLSGIYYYNNLFFH